MFFEALSGVLQTVESDAVVTHSHHAYEQFKATTFTPSKGPVFSKRWLGWLLIPALFALIVGYDFREWRQNNLRQAENHSQQAQAAFAGQNFAYAAQQWELALPSFQKLDNVDGQLTTLLALSRCYSALDRPSDAKQRLAQAALLAPTGESEAAVEKAQRVFAVSRLADSVALNKRADFGNAFLAALDARSAFQAGAGTSTQLAGADRMAARCCLRLQNLEAAQTYFDDAKLLDPKNGSNKTLSADLQNLEGQLANGDSERASSPTPSLNSRLTTRAGEGRPANASPDRPSAGLAKSYPTYQRPKLRKMAGDESRTGYPLPSIQQGYAQAGYSAPRVSAPYIPRTTRQRHDPILPHVPSFPQAYQSPVFHNGPRPIVPQPSYARGSKPPQPWSPPSRQPTRGPGF